MTPKDFAIVCLLALAPVLSSSYNMQKWGDITGKPIFTRGLIETPNHDSVIVDSSRFMQSPSGSSSQYMRGDGSLWPFPSIPVQFNPQPGTNITITGSYPNATFSASADSVQFFSRAGRVRRILRVFSDTFTVNASSGFVADISAAGFTTLLGCPNAIAVKSTTTATSSPNVSIKDFSATSVTLNVVEGNASLVTVLGSNVLLGPSLGFASTTGLKVCVTAIGY